MDLQKHVFCNKGTHEKALHSITLYYTMLIMSLPLIVVARLWRKREQVHYMFNFLSAPFMKVVENCSRRAWAPSNPKTFKNLLFFRILSKVQERTGQGLTNQGGGPDP